MDKPTEEHFLAPPFFAPRENNAAGVKWQDAPHREECAGGSRYSLQE